MMKSTQWYRRLSEVPHLQYQSDPTVKRTALPQHNTVPNVDTYEFQGKRHASLSWRTPGGSTSASPAHSWQTKRKKGESEAQTALRQLRETLELPGVLSDYYFAIQNAHEALWKHRREELWVLPVVEELCWLNIRLVEAYPEVVRLEYDNKSRFVHIFAFGTLMTLYEREGFLKEALEIAHRAARFENRTGAGDSLEARLATLNAESTQEGTG